MLSATKIFPVLRLPPVESELHHSMKSIVRSELERERYLVVEEPLFPPTRRVSWAAYRPDLLGIRSDSDREELVIVECETHPNMKRFASKNFSSVWFEPTVYRDGSIRRILAVPAGSLHSVDLRLRKLWEIWLIGPTRASQKIPAIVA